MQNVANAWVDRVRRGGIAAGVMLAIVSAAGTPSAVNAAPASLPASDSATGVSESLRQRAVTLMRDQLDPPDASQHAADWRSRVRAAESLSSLDYPQGVTDAFQSELASSSQSPDPLAHPRRVELWRVMALAAHGQTQATPWVERLRDVLLDAKAADRDAAAESLWRLGYRLTASDVAQLDRHPAVDRGVAEQLLVAQHQDLETVESLLVEFLQTESLIAVEAAQLISEQTMVSPQVQMALQAASERAAANSLDYVHLTAAASLHAVQSERGALGARLREFAVREDSVTRGAACQALATVGTDADVSLLTTLLDDADAEVAVRAAYAICRIERRTPHHLAALDWVVIIAYALLMLAIGIYYARRTSSSEDYMLGGRTVSSWQAGLSLFASLLSTVTYLAIPGEMIKHGPMFLAGNLSIPIVILIVGWIVIPFIMRLRITTAYELLETRLGLGVRTMGSVYFLLLRLVWMAVIIYATTDKVLVPALNVDPHVAPLISVVLGVLTVIYTSMGGLRAVIVSDVIQSFILLGGALLSLMMISFQLGGAAEWWPTSWETHWDKPAIWFDPEARITVAAVTMSITLWWVCTASSDQVAVQRYLSTRDVKAARGALISAKLAGPIVMITLGILGFALLAFFQANPHMIPDGKRVFGDSDQLFAHYIVFGLPQGVSGLVIAGLLAAAMSSLSSGVNSTSTVVTVDFVERFRREAITEAGRMRLARWTSVVVGVMVISLSLLVGGIEGNLLELANKITNLLVVPLFILFFMAMLIPWATPFGTVLGSLASLAMAVATAYFEIWNLNFMWMMPMAFVTGILVGPLASLLPIGRRAA